MRGGELRQVGPGAPAGASRKTGAVKIPARARCAGTDDDAAIEAARAIRPYLDRLVDQPAADELDRHLADALNGRSDRPASARRLRTLLAAQQDTAWFLAEVLVDAPHYRPPYHQPRYRRRQVPDVVAVRAAVAGGVDRAGIAGRGGDAHALPERGQPARRRHPHPGLPDPPHPADPTLTRSHRLTSGLVFVQNKRPMADLLLALAEQVYGPGVRFRRLHESRAGAEAVVDALCLKRPSRGSGSAGVTVLDCDSVPSGLPKTLTRVAAAPGLRRGLWVRGHVRDLHPAHLRVFDVLFLMDMSDVEMEMVRSLIPVSPACADQLRERVESSIFPPEHLLVFTAGTDRTTGARLPEVARNPALLRLTEDDLDGTRAYSMLGRA